MSNMVLAPFRGHQSVSIGKTAFNLVRFLLPLHNVSIKKPVYTLLRYGFHLCLFIVPIWYSGHVVLWEESSLEWYWETLPDAWIDAMTLIVIGLGIFFAIRRIAFPEPRRGTSFADFFIITVAVLPFVTGYWYTHGTLDHINFFEQYMWYFHVISGEAMMVMMVLLFCRTRLRKDKCVACAACQIICPTRTLDWEDQGDQRNFKYSHYQCICCASCMRVCPEGAAELRHDIGIRYLYQVFSKKVIRKAELNQCSQCSAFFAPTPQVLKIEKIMSDNAAEIEPVALCNRCKKLLSGNRSYKTGNACL